MSSFAVIGVVLPRAPTNKHEIVVPFVAATLHQFAASQPLDRHQAGAWLFQSGYDLTDATNAPVTIAMPVFVPIWPAHDKFVTTPFILAHHAHA